MALGQFKLQSAAIGAQLTLGLLDRGLDAVEIFAGKGGGRPAKYEDLLGIADGRVQRLGVHVLWSLKTKNLTQN